MFEYLFMVIKIYSVELFLKMCILFMMFLKQVIFVRKGEFEIGFERGGQIREYVMLVKIVGVKYLVVVINKMDDLIVMWLEDR